MTFTFLGHRLEREKLCIVMSVPFPFAVALLTYMFPREGQLNAQQVSDACLLLLTLTWYTLSSTERKKHVQCMTIWVQVSIRFVYIWHEIKGTLLNSPPAVPLEPTHAHLQGWEWRHMHP